MAIETPRGLLIAALRSTERRVYAINPTGGGPLSGTLDASPLEERPCRCHGAGKHSAHRPAAASTAAGGQRARSLRRGAGTRPPGRHVAAHQGRPGVCVRCCASTTQDSRTHLPRRAQPISPPRRPRCFGDCTDPGRRRKADQSTNRGGTTARWSATQYRVCYRQTAQRPAPTLAAPTIVGGEGIGPASTRAAGHA